MSVQQDRSPDDVRVGPWIPSQRTESPAPEPTSRVAPEPVATSPANDATVVLPVFVTGKKPEQPPAQQALAETKLPSSERGMLLFVAALLGLGTIAVVSMMGLGLTGSGAAPTRSVAPSPSPTVVVVAPLPPASPAPSDPPSPSAPPSKSPAASRHTSPTPVVQGTLSYADLVGYCQAANGGTAWPPGHNRNGWSCLAGQRQRKDFTPTDVCQWRFHDPGSRALVGDLTDPSTWRCRT